MRTLAEFVRRNTTPLLWLGSAIAVAMLGAHQLDAHKAVTSRYTYNEHIFPILRDKCGRCHVDGGAAPMSLLSYKDKGGAVAWAGSMVRRAVIAVEKGPVLAVWEPGDETAAAPGGTAFRLPAGAKLSVRIHYKKSWQDEQQEKSDKSSIGLYFTEEPLSGKEIAAF